MDSKSAKIKSANCAIDSASLVLPLSQVKLLHNDLIRLATTSAAHLVVLDKLNGEILENLNPRINSDVKHSDGITTTYYRLENTNIGACCYRQCVAISVNSKLLKKKYLKGINAETVQDLYAEIISQGIIYLTFDAFINGFLTDIDIKADYGLFSGFSDFNHLINSIFESTKFEFKKTNAVKKYNSKGNQGIQFGYRSNGSNMPFFKIYNKKVELENNSCDFMNEYNIICSDIVRFEITLKNKIQMIQFSLLSGEEKQTFKNILAHVGVFDMKKVVSVYSGKVRPKVKGQICADFDKMQRVERQAFDITVEMLELLDSFGVAVPLEDIRMRIVRATRPGKNNVRRVNDVIELAYLWFCKERESSEDQPDVFDLFC